MNICASRALALLPSSETLPKNLKRPADSLLFPSPAASPMDQQPPSPREEWVICIVDSILNAHREEDRQEIERLRHERDDNFRMYNEAERNFSSLYRFVSGVKVLSGRSLIAEWKASLKENGESATSAVKKEDLKLDLHQVKQDLKGTKNLCKMLEKENDALKEENKKIKKEKTKLQRYFHAHRAETRRSLDDYWERRHSYRMPKLLSRIRSLLTFQRITMLSPPSSPDPFNVPETAMVSFMDKLAIMIVREVVRSSIPDPNSRYGGKGPVEDEDPGADRFVQLLLRDELWNRYLLARRHEDTEDRTPPEHVLTLGGAFANGLVELCKFPRALTSEEKEWLLDLLRAKLSKVNVVVEVGGGSRAASTSRLEDTQPDETGNSLSSSQ
ncbi:hypothetical protein BT69DRAFT_1321228 [Atractiella rhizophila]|nr:hypothetical protein BT69DRAFT_1321228 [Atractiella rhizophila]